jgi:hypothetical protein
MMRNYHVLFSEENQINIFFYYISHVRNVTWGLVSKHCVKSQVSKQNHIELEYIYS